jgi:ACT domain-containing protein
MVLLSKHVAVNQKEKNTMRAVITVIGKDRVGIIAGVSKILADANVNILDITQTIMQGLFTMIMLVEISGSSISFEQLASNLAAKGDELGLKIRIQHEDIFKSMHEI